MHIRQYSTFYAHFIILRQYIHALLRITKHSSKASIKRAGIKSNDRVSHESQIEQFLPTLFYNTGVLTGTGITEVYSNQQFKVKKYLNIYQKCILIYEAIRRSHYHDSSELFWDMFSQPRRTNNSKSK